MSLASFISYLFISDSTQRQQSFAPSNKGWFANNFTAGQHGEGQDTSIQDGSREKLDQIMEEEEEARPPYVHVCWGPFAPDTPGTSSKAI